jgi:hypothetical protein
VFPREDNHKEAWEKYQNHKEAWEKQSNLSKLVPMCHFNPLMALVIVAPLPSMSVLNSRTEQEKANLPS